MAAPFEGNGVVYIFLGGPNGLSSKASQRIAAPEDFGQQMMFFGYGLSKGFDIDTNGYSDFAIGAPNVDVTYVYRAFPVATISATLTSDRQIIKPVNTTFTIKACWSLQTTHTSPETSNVYFYY